MPGTDLFANLVLTAIAIVSAGVLLAIGLGQIRMKKAERKGLAVGAAIVLVAIGAYMVLS